MSKCERLRSSLEKNLSQIQTMVPCMLNAQVCMHSTLIFFIPFYMYAFLFFFFFLSDGGRMLEINL